MNRDENALASGARLTDLDTFVAPFADLTAGRHLARAVMSFDEKRLRKLLATVVVGGGSTVRWMSDSPAGESDKAL